MHQLGTTGRSAGCPRISCAGAALLTILWGCTPDDRADPAAALVQVPVATVSVIPGRLQIPAGVSYRLNVALGDAAGNVLPDRTAGGGLVTSSSDGQPTAVVGDAKGRTGRVVTWRSDRPSVASVDEAGTVSALSPGEATITATSGERMGSTKLTVLDPEPGPMALIPARATLSAGESLDLRTLLTGDGELETATAARSITWEVTPPSHARLNPAGRVTALAAGTVAVTASDGRRSAAAELTIRPAATIHGLDFPGNAGVDSTLRFEFRSPPPAFPATYIWRAYPRQQQSYYTAFFWGNNGAFHSSNTYYGFHPYPDWDTDHQHFWEIAAPPGEDIVSSRHVVYDRWYTQVAVCKTAGKTAVFEFYWDWPDMTRVIRHTGSLSSDPPAPALVIGDAPWNPGNEVWDGVLRGFQFYNTALAPEEIAKELAAPGSVRSPWYLNLNPTPGDLADKSGHGHHPDWVGSERPSLWTGKMTDSGIILTDVDPR